MKRSSFPSASGSLERYLAEINHVPLLTPEVERKLARTYLETGDARVAHRLVTANLRFVVKVAYGYRSYGFRMGDLIQEGNLGLIKAVEKFDPEREIRLVSYAVWWIRAYIQNYIVKSYSLVKIGTTQAQRKLFFSLARTKRELDRASSEHGVDSDGENTSKIAKKLNVKPGEVEEMTQRMGSRDLSLDAPMGEEHGTDSHLDCLAGSSPSQHHDLEAAQQRTAVQVRVAEALSSLDPRERYIIEQRLMGEESVTLKDLGDHFGCSRERARQLEVRAKGKLKQELQELAVALDWPTDGEGFALEERVAA